jgi:UDP-GlcNAc:undecaprenyl-phosphate/decaprenyl-phosphate GlcNAc-1-phosphate transferase
VSVEHIAMLVGIAAVATFALTPVVRAASLKFGLVDEPGGRKVHTGEISRLGGIALFTGFGAALALQYAGETYLGWKGLVGVGGAQVGGVVAGLVIIFVVGVVDDIITLEPGPKLIGQIFAALAVIGSGVRIDFIGHPFGSGLIALGLAGIPLTLVYIVGFANVINLIDGLDGLAAGVTAIAATTFLVLAMQSNQPVAAVFAAALIGACVGFLRYNFNPASIFMGDSGAMFLGFALASISLLGVMKSVAAIALAVPLLIIGVPIFDTASAIIRRIRHKRPIQEADRGHIHHRLLGRGFDQRQTVLIIYVWSAALAVGGYAVRYAPVSIKLVAFAVLAGLSAFMVSWLGLFEAAHHHPETAEDPHDEGGGVATDERVPRHQNGDI